MSLSKSQGDVAVLLTFRDFPAPNGNCSVTNLLQLGHLRYDLKGGGRRA